MSWFGKKKSPFAVSDMTIKQAAEEQQAKDRVLSGQAGGGGFDGLMAFAEGLGAGTAEDQLIKELSPSDVSDGIKQLESCMKYIGYWHFLLRRESASQNPGYVRDDWYSADAHKKTLRELLEQLVDQAKGM